MRVCDLLPRGSAHALVGGAVVQEGPPGALAGGDDGLGHPAARHRQHGCQDDLDRPNPLGFNATHGYKTGRRAKGCFLLKSSFSSWPEAFSAFPRVRDLGKEIEQVLAAGSRDR
jgi:hypothetical protein